MIRLCIALPLALVGSLALAQPDAYSGVNALRAAAGLAALKIDPRLAEAAAGHAGYLVDNNSSEHYQSADGFSFTGRGPAQRAIAVGYANRLVSENLSKGEPEVRASLRGLMAAIYHRFGFLDPQMTHIGIGIRGQGGNTAMVYLMGNNDLEKLCRRQTALHSGRFVTNACADKRLIAQSAFQAAINRPAQSVDALILWPPPNAGDIPPAFYDETPDPLPDLTQSGYPISVQVNTTRVKTERLRAFELYDLDTGQRIDETRLITPDNDPHHKFDPGEYALFPIQRLRWGGRYEARLTIELDGKTLSRQWRFTTTAIKPRPIIIRGRGERLSMVSGDTLNLVVETRPRDPVLTRLSYRQRTDVNTRVTRIDANTLSIHATGPGGSTIKFFSDNGPRFEILIRRY